MQSTMGAGYFHAVMHVLFEVDLEGEFPWL